MGKVKRGHKLLGASRDFGHVSAVAASRPVFEKICADIGRTDLDYLVGLPGDFDTAMFTLGPLGALRHRRAFTEATVAEITRIYQMLGDQAVFQLEVPAELVLLTKLPATLRLPSETRFIAGFAHEEQSLDEQRRVLAMIEKLLSREVDVASSCGLGRREPAAARRTLQRTAELCAG